MIEIAVVLILAFVVLMALDVPIAFAIILAGFLAILAEGSSDPGVVLALKLTNGVNSFVLLAIPFFILSGNLMGRGGLARRLIDFTSVLVGTVPGGLSYVNTLTCMLFGSISGSSAAAVSSIGGFMIPEMNRKGYDRDFNVAVTTTAATTGLMIPPSNVMIVYSVAAGSVSIAAMFMAGVVPGILTGLCIMFAAAVVSLMKGFRGEEFEIPTWKRLTAIAVIAACIAAVVVANSAPWVAAVMATLTTIVCLACFETFRNAFLTLLMIVIVIGGILAGIFTATEAAAISVVYAFILSFVFYRQIKLTELPAILQETCVTSAVVLLLIAACAGLSWILTLANIPQTVSALLLSMSDNPIVILIAINVLLICVGTFMDMTPAILIFTPIFLPVVEQLGMHPIHFGMMLIVNLSIGLCTPPVGTCLFIGCKVGETTIANMIRPLLPFYMAMIVALVVITYVPSTCLWLPVKTKQLKQQEVDKFDFLATPSVEASG